MEAASIYRAVQAVSPGRLELTEKTFQAPGPGKVRIRIEAGGVCHSDSGTVEALFPIEWPRVPGHEVVGRIDALGPGVPMRPTPTARTPFRQAVLAPLGHGGAEYRVHRVL
jgi:D-arabinose 1-dehydrogenase-like Zn-dependent alcohol dehydrogenase